MLHSRKCGKTLRGKEGVFHTEGERLQCTDGLRNI